MDLCAGILIQDPDGRVLLLRRGADAPDYAGFWSFPGGHAEPEDENLLATALRETEEETGRKVAGANPFTRSMMRDVDFTTFMARSEAFTPELCDENDAFIWAKPGELPEPMHPGAQVAVDRLSMDEMQIAEAMVAGKLAFPQYFHNLALFALRITGTGLSYRAQHKEHVWRDPAIFLDPAFLKRCNGLPVIIYHPPKGKTMLDGEEFAKRIAGSIVLPYVSGDEAWGIAKVWDEQVAEEMARGGLSTSPGVVFTDLDANTTIKDGDGGSLLIEGKPQLLDHLALCERGVWDKGGPSAGVSVDSIGDTEMVEKVEDKKDGEVEEKTEAKEERSDAARMDAAAAKMDFVADQLLKRMDAFEGRMGALEGKSDRKDAEGMTSEECAKKDAEEKEAKEAKEREDAKKDAARRDAEKKDAAKKDGEGETEEEKKAREDSEKEARDDGARKDAVISDLQTSHKQLVGRLADLEKAQTRSRSADDRRTMLGVQTRFDSVFREFGDEAPAFMDGETANDYSRRLTGRLAERTTKWGKLNVFAMDEATYAALEPQIRADAIMAAHDAATVPEGELIPVVETDMTGRRLTKYRGQPNAWMKDFKSEGRAATLHKPS